MTIARDWDAGTYDAVGAPVQAFGHALLDRLALEGDEAVLDAGCGSGAVTKALLERLPGRAGGRGGRLARDDRARPRGARRGPPPRARARRPRRARAGRARRHRVLQRRLSLDRRPRGAVRPPACRAPARRGSARPVRGGREHRRRPSGARRRRARGAFRRVSGRLGRTMELQPAASGVRAAGARGIRRRPGDDPHRGRHAGRSGALHVDGDPRRPPRPAPAGAARGVRPDGSWRRWSIRARCATCA